MQNILPLTIKITFMLVFSLHQDPFAYNLDIKM
jgi:hypothetical protein